MGRKCSVENCSSDSTKPEHTGVTFHKVPLHPDIRPKWMSLCRIPQEKVAVKLLFVCSRHFLRADFCNFKGKKYLLRQGVLPSVFPWDKSRLEAIKAVANSGGGKKDVQTPPPKRVRAKKVKKKPTEQPKIDVLPKTDIKQEPPDVFNEVKTESTTEEVNPQNDYVPPKTIKEDPEITITTHETDLFDQHQRSQNTSPDPTTSNSISFTINAEIEALDDNNVWHVARINEVDYEENEVLIHFKIPSKCDEWISMSSPRLRPVQPLLPLVVPVIKEEVKVELEIEDKPESNLEIKGETLFNVGDRCMAIWCDNRRFPATITKLLDKDSYEVLFDDGYVKILKSNKLTKMQGTKPAQASPLFEPVKGTKQERREKKRKLNVAALFPKRPRLIGDEKKTKHTAITPITSPVIPPPQDEMCSSPNSQDETGCPINTLDDQIPKWLPTWENGKPVGIESTLDVVDGFRKSTIVPDPRLPHGWAKHISQRIFGHNIGKWETVIVAPDGKKFRSRHDVKNYLDLHPNIEALPHQFDFSLFRKNYKRNKPIRRSKQQSTTSGEPKVPPVEQLSPEEAEPLIEEQPPAREPTPPPEEPPVSLKIIYENDSYKCPIEGCGKHFRRENLALMHVKHYHSEYTKYMDATPNVADLAYARTVGENLDRSPGTLKNTSLTASGTSSKIVGDKTPVTPRTSKVVAHADGTSVGSPAMDVKAKDLEIIKLLNQKPADVGGDIQPLPSGLPSNMYPDIKLKDLLGKHDDIAMRDDVHIKTLCSSRPSQGIKTLLPVRHVAQNQLDTGDDKSSNSSKRKRTSLDAIDAKGKFPYYAPSSPTPYDTPFNQSATTSHQSQHQQQHRATPPINIHHQSASSLSSAVDEATEPSIPSAFDLAPPPAELETTLVPPPVTQFDGVIIEGGKIIKLERMKMEEIINCTCGFMEEDGLMIQCELCLCWQHAYCNNIQKESEVPEKYVCFICQHPFRERRSQKYLHDQDWMKQGVLPVASYHCKDKVELEKRFEKLKKCHDLSGGILELREYMHTLGVKLKVAEAKNHPKLYLWSKPWDKPKLPEKIKTEDGSSSSDIKPKLETSDHQYIKNGHDVASKLSNSNDSMLMMILKSGKEEVPMLNNMAPIIPRPEAAIDSDDCRLNLLDHIAHGESLVEERLDEFEKQLDALEENMNMETEEDYPKMRQTLQLLMRDLDCMKRFSELPMV